MKQESKLKSTIGVPCWNCGNFLNKKDNVCYLCNSDQ